MLQPCFSQKSIASFLVAKKQVENLCITHQFIGDLSYYWLIERQPLAVRPLNELYAQESCLGLAASERIDGKLVRSEAVKLFKLN